MPDSDTSPNLGLPFYQTKQNEFEVQHNEALLMLDALVMLAAIDRDLSAPPASPSPGDRYLVKSPGTGDFAGNDDRIAQYDVGGWNFYAPRAGWTCYVQDEHVLLAWDGSAWAAALDVLGGVTELQNLSLLGVGTAADATNPLSAKLNNVLWVAKTAAEGGDGTLRYKLSKENEAATLSLLFQDNFSGRAEIGLTADDDFHFKTSADGSVWVDAFTLDGATGAAKLNSALALTGDISPAQITADQDDYNPAGLAQASVLRLSTDASRNISGLAGGADGRVVTLINVGSSAIVLKDAGSGSIAANRFEFGADITVGPNQSAVLWYDATDSRWKLFAGPQTAGSIDHPGYVSGNWYQGSNALSVGSNTAFSNQICFVPWLPKARMTVDQLAVLVSSPQAGSHFQLAVYGSDMTTKRPTGTPLGYTASTSGVASGAASASLNSNVQVEAGTLYYLALNCDVASLGFQSFGTTFSAFGWMLGSATLTHLLSGSTTQFALRVINTYNDSTPTNTFPDLTSATFSEATGASFPNICFHIASLP